MKDIPNEILELISGGFADIGGGSTSIQSVEIHDNTDHGSSDSDGSNPQNEVDLPGFPFDPFLGGGGGEPFHNKHHKTPKPTNFPSGVDPDQLRNFVLTISDKINALDPSVEHGCVVFRDANGNLRVGPITHGTAGGLNLDEDHLPGEMIIATVHSHPGVPGVPENWLPSTQRNAENGIGDVESARALIDGHPELVDPNMMMYIIDSVSHVVAEFQGKVGENVSKSDAGLISEDEDTDD